MSAKRALWREFIFYFNSAFTIGYGGVKTHCNTIKVTCQEVVKSPLPGSPGLTPRWCRHSGSSRSAPRRASTWGTTSGWPGAAGAGAGAEAGAGAGASIFLDYWRPCLGISCRGLGKTLVWSSPSTPKWVDWCLCIQDCTQTVLLFTILFAFSTLCLCIFHLAF